MFAEYLAGTSDRCMPIKEAEINIEMSSSSIKQLRSEEQVREHYEIERKLADRLKKAPRTERRKLYTTLYEELFRLVPHHMQLTKKKSPDEREREVEYQLRLIRKFTAPDKTFMEVGAGDCAVVFEVSKSVKRTYAVEVSPSITASKSVPANFRLLLSNGCSIPCEDEQVDVIYSNQLMEHLHPEDAAEQLENIYRTLSSEGVYICLTPNRLSGPHDVSRNFDTVAKGLHLKEYTARELTNLFRNIGFGKIMLYSSVRGRFLRVPVALIITLERLLEMVPEAWRAKLARTRIVTNLIDIKLVGVKST